VFPVVHAGPREGERLLVRLPYSPPALLVPEGEHVFVGNSIQLTFHVEEGRCESVSVLWPGQPAAVHAWRVSPAEPGRR
jgi:hypothetical protein